MTDRGPDAKPKPFATLLRPLLRARVSWKVVVGAVVVLGLAAGLFVAAGGINISADRPDGPLARTGLHFVFKRNVAARARSVSPPADLAAPSRVRIAAQHFDMVCANCHGRPGFGQSVTALSMNPRPQYLPKVVGQFTDSELYLIVEHGVKYSAMPAWPTDANTGEVWSMVAFLRHLPKMDAGAYRRMTALPTGAPALLAPSGGDAGLRPANAARDTPPADEFLYAAPASGFGDTGIHDNPAVTCARCHGADGSGAVTGGEAPNLTIHDAAYLRAALDAYSNGTRRSGFMQTIAAQISGAQAAALADHYAGAPAHPAVPAQGDAALVERGRIIATQGLRERALPACAQCHESQGATITGAPHIAGQSAVFLRRELDAMRRGGRGGAARWNPMSSVAGALEDKDIAAVAAYYAGLQPAKAPGSAPMAPARLSDGQSDMARVKHIFESSCEKCHANGGRGDRAGGFPDLTLQTAPYIAQTLYTFRTRARPNQQMRDVIDSLSYDEMTGLAAYIGALAPQRAVLAPPAPAAAARGAAIATQGVPGRNIPACLNCHGAKGVAALPLIPRLNGHSVLYLRTRLDNFAKPYNVNLSALNPMPAIAGQLTAGERADLAAYFAAAAPLAKTPPATP